MLHRQVVVTEALIHISADEKENDRFVEGKQLLCGGYLCQINLILLKLWSIYLPTREKMTDLLEISWYYVGERGVIGSQLILVSLKFWSIDQLMRKK